VDAGSIPAASIGFVKPNIVHDNAAAAINRVRVALADAD
jgi:hypothetical protein